MLENDDVEALFWAIGAAQSALRAAAEENTVDRRQSVNMIAHLAEISDKLRIENVKTLDADKFPCLCVRRHVPEIDRTHRHHIIPLSWDGPDEDDNVVALCPSGHDQVHLLLQQWERAGERLLRRNANKYLYGLAAQAWDWREGNAPTEEPNP